VDLSRQAEQEITQGVVRAVRAALAALPGGEEVRFGAREGALQVAWRQAGAVALERVLAEVGTGFVGETRPCPCGAAQETDHYAEATWQTVLGPVRVRRAAYRCPTCHTAEIPLDARIGLSGERLSPGLRALLSLFCAAVPFAEAGQLLHKAVGVRLSAKRAQLVSEAVGVRLEQIHGDQDGPPLGRLPAPVVRPRLSVGLDGVLSCTRETDEQGRLQWREAKVGVFYTPLPQGAPGTGRRSRLTALPIPVDVADPESHSYVVHMGDWRRFAAKVWREGIRRGSAGVQELVVLSDGAEWITSLRAEIFDGLDARVTHILDLRHAQEHLWAVARACLGPAAEAWSAAPLADLSHGRVDALLTALRALEPPTTEAATLVETTCAYYDTRRALLDYPRFRAQGYQIGSGVAESACKRVVGQRQKGAGMHWLPSGAQAIGTLRATALSNRWAEVEALCAA